MSTNAETNSEGIDNLRQAHDELKAKYTELQGKYRDLAVSTAFKEAQLNAKHAELFMKVHPEGEDITVDAVRKFAQDYELQPQQAPQQPGTPPQPSNQPEGRVVQPNPEAGLAGMAGAGGASTGTNPPSSPGQKMSQAEFQKLIQTDRAAAIQAYAEGRVQVAEGNVFAEQAKRAGVME